MTTLFNVTCSCGHNRMIELNGSYEVRYHKIMSYQTEGLCPSCYYAKYAALNNRPHTDVLMPYHEYKTNYSDCKIEHGSYDARTKTIIVHVPD